MVRKFDYCVWMAKFTFWGTELVAFIISSAFNSDYYADHVAGHVKQRAPAISWLDWR